MDMLLYDLMSANKKKQFVANVAAESSASKVLLPNALNVLRKRKRTFLSHDRSTILDILSNNNTKANLQSGIKEILDACPKFVGLNMTKINRWRISPSYCNCNGSSQWGILASLLHLQALEIVGFLS